MDFKLRRFSGLLSTTIGLTLLTSVAPQLWAQNQASTETPDTRWAKVSVVLPTSATTFPAGNGADIANSQCLICHSAGWQAQAFASIAHTDRDRIGNDPLLHLARCEVKMRWTLKTRGQK